MKNKFFFAVFTLSIFVVPNVWAEEKTRWSDEAELSYVDTSGNSEVTTFSAKNSMKYKFTDKLDGLWKITALNGKSDGIRSAENYSTEVRLDYALTERFYTALVAGWLKDTFAGIDPRYYVGPAAGYKILLGPKHFLNSEVGLDYVTEDYTDGTDNEYLRGRIFTKYEYAITEKNKFSQSLEYLYDFDDGDNYNVISVSALTAAVSDVLSMKTSYEVKYDNSPVPATLERTDTILSVALVFNFK